MEIMYKAFRQIDDKTLMSIFAPTKYKVGKTKVFKKCPTFVSDDISYLWRLFNSPGVSIWEVVVENKVEVPRYLLDIDELTQKKICDFWNGKIPGRLFVEPQSSAYLKIKPLRKIEEYDPAWRKFRRLQRKEE